MDGWLCRCRRAGLSSLPPCRRPRSSSSPASRRSSRTPRSPSNPVLHSALCRFSGSTWEWRDSDPWTLPQRSVALDHLATPFIVVFYLQHMFLSYQLFSCYFLLLICTLWSVDNVPLRFYKFHSAPWSTTGFTGELWLGVFEPEPSALDYSRK